MSTASDPICRTCRTPMEKGVQLDRADGGGIFQMQWWKGEPRMKKFLGLPYGLAVNPKDALTIVTWRCPRCGVLESFARA